MAGKITYTSNISNIASPVVFNIDGKQLQFQNGKDAQEYFTKHFANSNKVMQLIQYENNNDASRPEYEFTITAPRVQKDNNSSNSSDPIVYS